MIRKDERLSCSDAVQRLAVKVVDVKLTYSEPTVIIVYRLRRALVVVLIHKVVFVASYLLLWFCQRLVLWRNL